MPRAALLLLAFALLSLSSAKVQRLLLNSKTGPPQLDVTIGMSQALTSRHLAIFHRARNGDLCRVEVDDNEPTSLMVGRLEPRKFNCFFGDNEVTYHHEGSPLINFDTIKLTVYYFWKNNTLVQNALIRVAIKLQPDHRVFQPLSDLVVKTSKAITAPISSDILRFRYDPDTERCTVSYFSLKARGGRSSRGPWMATRKWPAIGRLVDHKKRVVDSFEHDCQELLLMGYRYEHRKPGSPDMDFVPLMVRVQAKGAGPPFPERRESLYLKVGIRNSAPNRPPVLRVRTVKLTNIGGTLEKLPADAISIDKDESRPRYLIVNVTSFTGNVPAQLVNGRDPSRKVTSFTYEDFKDGNIFFQITSYKTDAIKEYILGLRVLDGYLARSAEQYIMIKNSLMNGQILQYFNPPIYTFTRATSLLKKDNFKVLGDRRGVAGQKMRYSITGTGPTEGNILVQGLPLTTFASKEINAQIVVYQHRGYSGEADNLPLRATYSTERARLRVPIHIVKLHDRRLVLKPAAQLKVDPHFFRCLTTDLIDRIARQDLERDATDVRFEVTKAPTQGFLAHSVGEPPLVAPRKPLSSFSFRDLLLGRICYRHTGWSGDKLTLKQLTEPDLSLPSVTITIDVPVAPKAPLQREMDPNVMLEVPESANSVPVNRVFLRYSARGVAPQNIWYHVTAFPRFSDANITLDAGRLINLKDLVRQGHTGDTQITSVIKDLKNAQIGTVNRFSQQQINSGDIAYVPPLNDVGVSDRIVFLNFTVVTSVGHRLTMQQIRIRVKAEDDKAPQLRTKVIAIQRGSQCVLRNEDIRISDVDTPLKKVIVEVTKLPAHGDLIDERGRVMLTGYRFPATAIVDGKIKYSNNGINFKTDKFNITVSDGPRTTNVTTVLMNITDYDWNIGAWKDYVNYSIQVLENASVTIREAVFPMPLAKTKVADSNVLYFVYENPVKGAIMRGDGVVSQFTLQDVRLSLIRYKHTAGEVGASTVYDFAKVSMYIDGDPLGLRKINFSIIPVNSQAPRIKVMSDLIVIEGRRDLQSIVGYNVLAAIDKDTRESDVRIRVINKPLWGKIVVDEKEAYDFTMAQIREGVVKYIQSKSGNGIEETRDQFSVTANDGKYMSKNEFVNVTIIPVNDEPPQLFLKNFNIDRGGSQRLDKSIFSVKDADIPQDDLQVRIRRLPKAGNLVVFWKNGDKQPVTRWRNVFSRHYLALTDLVYEHRRSDKAFKDSFEISVSDGKHQVSKTCQIRIMGENRLPPTLPSSHTLLIKSDVMGTLTKAQLDAKDADTPPPSLLYTLRRPPAFGQLVMGQENKLQPSPSATPAPSATFNAKLTIDKGKTFTQADINSGKVAYLYLGKTKERVEDSLEVDLTDGKVTLGPRRIVVVVSNPPQNHPLSMKAGVIKVIRGGRAVISPRDVKIENNVTPVDRLKLEVAQMARCGLLLDTKAATKASLTSFLYNELYDDRIVFSVKDCPADTKELAIILVVSDMSARAEASLRILIVSQPPVVTRFLPLKLEQNTKATIGPDLINTEDPDTPPDRIVYTLAATPEFGVLVRDRREVRPGETFSQADINQRHMYYLSIKKAPAGKDVIRLHVSDGDHTTYGFAGNKAREGPIDFPVIILPVTQKLVLVVNRAPKSLINFGNMGYGFQFSEENLKSNFPKMTKFVVKRRPFIGELGLRRGSGTPEMTFTSADLAEGSLYYTTKGDKSKVMTNDSFEFILAVNKDVKGADQFTNNTKLHRMDLMWPKVQFARKRYKICERAGTLTLRVVRSGLLYSKVSLRLSTEAGRGTRMPRDYLPSGKTVLEFDAGETEKIYKVTIMDASRKKAKFNKKRRRFYVSIDSANNALIGEVPRAMVVIREGKKCRPDADYFLTPQEEKKARLAAAEREKSRQQRLQAADERYMLHDLVIPSDAELRRQSLLDRQLPLFELPSSEELRKYEQHKVNLATLSALSNFPQCKLEMNGQTRDHHMRTYICDGVREEWLPLEDVFKDLPGCKPGWILNGKRCFRFYDTPMTWTGAKVSCVMRGARLAAPLSMERQKWITQKIAKKERFWIGLHYDPQRDMWLYTDKSSPKFTRWHRRRPSRRKLRRRNSRRCVMVSSFFSWVPRRCSSAKHSYGFVCEQEAT